MNRWKVFLLFVLLAGCSRTSDNDVATVLGKGIPAEEFRARLETYIGTTGVRDNIVLRQTIVTNMINEALMLENIRENEWERRPEIRKRLKEIRNQALLDGYSKKLVAHAVKVSEPELREEFRLSNTKVSARYVYAKSNEKAWELKRKLEKGASFVALAREVFEDPGLYENGGYVGYFGKGEMEAPFEEAAFRTPVGRISDPVRLSMGYAVIKVEDRKQIPLASEHDYANKKGKLEEEVRKRKVKEMIEGSALEIGRGLKAVFNDDVLGKIAEEWRTISGLDASERLETNNTHRENLETVLGWVEGKEWTVGMLSERIAEITEKQKKRVNSVDDVKAVVLGLATRDVLLRRAVEEGLERDKDVMAQVENVRKSVLLNQWVKSVYDTAGSSRMTEGLLRQYFEKKEDLFFIPPEVNVAEVLVQSSSVAGHIVEQLRRGVPFEKLVEKYSIRRHTVRQGGELGFGSGSKYGALTDRFMRAKIGSLIGPLFVDPYYGVFKLIGKREGRRMTFEEAESDIRNQILLTGRQDALRRAIDVLRSNASFTVHQKVLENVVLDSSPQVKEVAQ